MTARRHRRGWAWVSAVATLLCILQTTVVLAEEHVRTGQRSHRLHPEDLDTVSKVASAEDGSAAATDDATHQLTAGAMHPKKVLRPAIAAAHHTAHPHEHHHITHRGGGYGMTGDRPACRARDMFSQSGSLPGEWVPHADTAWAGDYEHGECPHFAKDFDCTTGAGELYHRNKELAKTEFNKVFQPYKCELQPFSDRGFDKCLAGRRLIMIGDSTMNGIFSSLACLLRNRIESGRHMPWEVSNITKIHDNIEYMSRGGEAIKQVTGEMFLEGGGEFKLYGFGRFNLTLWDKVIDELQPITKRDTILVNFGAWYHRFFFDKGPKEYQAWQHDIYELLHERLKNYPAQVQQELPDRIPPLDACKPTKIGEYWFDQHMHNMLKSCGQPCAHIGILPLFEASLGAHNLHHGIYGRGREEGEIDCTHYCQHARDVWSTILYNYMCGG
ncbi:hypothetical protein COCSUDRAFT_44250 [Coccomyxa subellipsoidea C-169]|uniref:Trichome birefringence-like N-terminal domain-containing protein n=1 Tax=Coccomyxa subellipsoidea (strain C-169) TaxID=574566 RepID=I0YN55_COCSC|nr:hypothetical protein COCSUDRAFT_44250 [Coccomyxa subellipsoidea C-169]EIE19824.1 hypothetical protein COCSUDRAFT_44250 [Coccomyxa subellipsoidea C-169]|eukprot:XP_005644368.1 hypothetical protein COCSUDRAFT_44250 [Coccomyxa subellipsoidea C-169]